MKKLLLAFAAAVLLVFPASAAAAVTPHYVFNEAGTGLACVVVTLDGVDVGGKPVTVRFKSPSGSGSGILRNWNQGDYPMTFCVSQSTYFAAGGYGWTATASAGGISLGSTVF